MIEISSLELFSIIASIISIILGIVAIYLSILFYKMTENSSRASEKTSTNIDSNVQKLEALFNKLYTGTFDMMKETVTDMRKYVYSNGPTEEKLKTEDKILSATISELSEDIQKIKNNNISEKDITKLIEEALNKSKKIESDIANEQLKQAINRYFESRDSVTYSKLRTYLLRKKIIKDSTELFYELEKMVQEGLIEDPFDYDTGNKAISVNKELRHLYSN